MGASLRTRLAASILRVWRLVRPNPLVDREFYLKMYPDVARLGMDPALHFFRHGLSERRNPNAYFDTDWYLASNPGVAASGMNPLDHYLLFGAAEGRDPGPQFDTDWYANQYSDVGRQNPLLHYLRRGSRDGRQTVADGLPLMAVSPASALSAAPQLPTRPVAEFGPRSNPVSASQAIPGAAAGLPRSQGQGSPTGHLRDDKFIISCAARSGSTMLMFLLGSHPEIICHGEPYDHADKVGHLDGRYRRLRSPAVEASLWLYLTQYPVAFLYDVLFDHQDRRIAGFKYKIDEAFGATRPHRQDLQRSIARDTDIKIISLKRRDLLAQFISHEVSRRTGVHLVVKEPMPTVEPFSVSPRQVLDYFTETQRRHKRADEAYRNHRQIQVYYEDLVQQDGASRSAVLDFLGVSPAPMTTPSKRIVTDGYRLLENRDEVVRALRSNGYGDLVGVA
jgi:LPS sulfotransferase NodH